MTGSLPHEHQQHQLPRTDSILLEAAKLFAERGFAATTIRNIGQACDMSPGLIFHHYGSKRGLLVRVVAEGTLRAHAMVRNAVAEETDPLQRLRQLLRSHLAALHGEAKPFMVVAAQEFDNLTPAERSEVVAARDSFEHLWQQILDDAAAVGLVPNDPLLRLFLLGAVNQTHSWFVPAKGLGIEELADRFLMFVTGVGADISGAGFPGGTGRPGGALWP